MADLLGIRYRRVPLVAIGNDVYCDTNLIAPILERRFPPRDGYGTIYPNRKGSDKADTGMINALSRHYGDTVLFPYGFPLLPWEKFDDNYVQDRSAVSGSALSIIVPNTACLIVAESRY